MDSHVVQYAVVMYILQVVNHIPSIGELVDPVLVVDLRNLHD